MFGVFGPVRRCLSAQRRRHARGACSGDDPFDGIEDRRVALVEQLRTNLGVAVDAQHELGEVVGTDRHPVDAECGILRDPVDDRGNLGHHPAVQPAVAPQRARVDELEACFEFPPGAHERDHEMQVRGLVPDPGQDLELQSEQVGLTDVPVAAPVPDHGIVFARLELRSPGETAELVAPEIDRPVDDRSRRERARDPQQ